MVSMKTTLLVAWAEESNRLIGSKNGLPWKIPQDLKLFKERTLGHTVIFGLTTYRNLPVKPLPARVNIVVSDEATPDYLPPDLIFVGGIKEAIDYSRRCYPKRQIFICGGASIYKQALEQDLVDEMLVSQIPGKWEGDIRFPEFPHIWDREVIEEYDDFVVERWTRETK
jgi:dihydrofolate reductase